MTAIDSFLQDARTRQERCPSVDWPAPTPDWQCNHALRTDYVRSQALVKTHVPTVEALGLTLNELQTIYRVQFPVVRQYEAETDYDGNRRIGFTPSKGLPTVGLPRKSSRGDANGMLMTREGTKRNIPLGWENIRELSDGTIFQHSTVNTPSGGAVEQSTPYCTFRQITMQTGLRCRMTRTAYVNSLQQIGKILTPRHVHARRR